jgi:hypothetical protein
MSQLLTKERRERERENPWLNFIEVSSARFDFLSSEEHFLIIMDDLPCLMLKEM